LLQPRSAQAKLFLAKIDLVNEMLLAGSSKKRIAAHLGINEQTVRDLFKTYCSPKSEQ